MSLSSALGYPIYLLHEKDIVDTFPDQIIVDVEDEINPTWRQELEAKMNAEVSRLFVQVRSM